MTAISVRTMAAADIPRVAELAAQLGYPSSPDEMRRRFQWLCDDPDAALLVAESEGRILGWIQVAGRRLLEYDPFAEIGGLVVDSSCRRLGVGRLLTDAAEKWARGHGYREMRVRSRSERQEAHLFYPALDYESLKTQEVYRKAL